MSISEKVQGKILLGAALLLFSAGVYAQSETRPDLEGTWLGKLITFDDPRWSIEDVLCHRFCTTVSLEYLNELLADPANDDLSLEEIKAKRLQWNRDYVAGLLTTTAQARIEGFDQADDPVNDCIPFGFIRQSVEQPLPLNIEQFDDRVVIRYELWDTTRTIYTDGRNHPQDLEPSRMGHSIGWYDGPALVVETRGVNPGLYAIQIVSGLTTSDQAVIIERYTKSQDGNQLDVFMTISDPRMLRQAVTMKESYLSFPGLELQEFKCEVKSGEF